MIKFLLFLFLCAKFPPAALVWAIVWFIGLCLRAMHEDAQQ